MIRFFGQLSRAVRGRAHLPDARLAVQGLVTSRGYRAAKAGVASARQLRDELLVPEIARLHAENYGVYGRRKMHALVETAGLGQWDATRPSGGLRLAGVRGVRKSKKVFTTRPDKTRALPHDLVQRRFQAEAPRRLWVADITYVATWAGFAYVAFITDVYSRRIMGWNVAATLQNRTDPPARPLAHRRARHPRMGLVVEPTNASTANSACAPRPKSRTRTTLTTSPNSRPPQTKETSRNETPADSR